MIREKLITPIWIPVYHRYQMFYNSQILSPVSREGVRVIKGSLTRFFGMATYMVIQIYRRFIMSCHRGSYALQVKAIVAEGMYLLIITHRDPYSPISTAGEGVQWA